MGIVAAPAAPVLEVADELVRMRELRRRDDLRLGRVGAAVADVVADRAMQQRRVLGHHGDVRAQRFLGDRGNILTIDQDAPALQIEEAQQQVDQGRLAGAGAADQADLFARRNMQRQALDDSGLATVAELHVVEHDLAAA